MAPGRTYTIDLPGSTPVGTRLSVTGTRPAESVRITLPYPSASFEVIRDYNGSNLLIAAADLAELDASDGDRFYYDAATGLLHLKAVTRDNREYANLLIRP